jgi:hypothetical protein
MATPGQLVRIMAETLGVPAETVTNYDRVLSENGMRSKSGRGRGAAKVTAGDAANLLIAIMGSPIAGASVKEAANTCRTYGSLPVLGHVSGTIAFAKLGLPALDELPNKHTLHDGLSALIDSAAKGEHYRIPRYSIPGVGVSDPLFGINLAGPQPWAEIYADGTGTGEGKKFARLVYNTIKIVVGHAIPLKSDRQDKGNLSQSRRITYRTIRALGSLLAKGND